MKRRTRGRKSDGFGRLGDWETNPKSWYVAPAALPLGTSVGTRLIAVPPAAALSDLVQVGSIGSIEIEALSVDICFSNNQAATVAGAVAVGLHLGTFDAFPALTSSQQNPVDINDSCRDNWIYHWHRPYAISGSVSPNGSNYFNHRINLRKRIVVKEGTALTLSIANSLNGLPLLSSIAFQFGARWRIRKYD